MITLIALVEVIFFLNISIVMNKGTFDTVWLGPVLALVQHVLNILKSRGFKR